MEIDPVAEGLDGGDHSGHQLAPRDRVKITLFNKILVESNH
jgi:hypothetical protein